MYLSKIILNKSQQNYFSNMLKIVSILFCLTIQARPESIDGERTDNVFSTFRDKYGLANL